MSFSLTGMLVMDCPQAVAGDFIGKLNAAVPGDVTGATGDVDEQFPSPAAGDFRITANLTATVSQGDLGSLFTAVEAALAADGVTMVSGTVAWK